MQEILDVLTRVCEENGLPVAQCWLPYESDESGGSGHAVVDEGKVLRTEGGPCCVTDARLWGFRQVR
jgi:hypothetical protein